MESVQMVISVISTISMGNEEQPMARGSPGFTHLFSLEAHHGEGIGNTSVSASRIGQWRELTILGLNLTGFVWTVDQDTHHTVTVEFYDREYHRDFHFTDPYLYDKACLSKFNSCLQL